jgi:hypothetical protein
MLFNKEADKNKYHTDIPMTTKVSGLAVINTDTATVALMVC